MAANEQTGGGLGRLATTSAEPRHTERSPWAESLSGAIRDRKTLLLELDLPLADVLDANDSESDFPVLVPRSYLGRMTPGDANDPLLRQVLPVSAEQDIVPGFTLDAVGDQEAKAAPGLIHKYRGRVLMIATGACAVHCRYCFRRHYPYGDDPRRLDDWTPALKTIAADDSVHEVILSGGDPLMLTDTRLEELVGLIAEIPHVRRLRLHTRLPIVLPDRVTDRLLSLLRPGEGRFQAWMVVHANHANELVGDCADALKKLVRAGIPTLNQAVLLKGVNDSADALTDLCERLVDLGVQPYYLHLLDRVAGTAHFDVDEVTARRLLEIVRQQLPGYAVPTLVREIAGQASKTPVL